MAKQDVKNVEQIMDTGAKGDRMFHLFSRVKKFDGGNEEGWDTWIQRFELLAGLGDKNEWLESL